MLLPLSDTSLSLRAIDQRDEEILYKIYSSTRTAEMERVTWTDEQKEAFLRQQFNAQHAYYISHYGNANFWVIERSAEVIGRFYVAEDFSDGSIRIIDISLLPAWRNKKIGTGILKDIMQSGRQINRPVTIHVESFNPAMKLYETLGFKMVSKTNGVYYLMQYKPENN